MGEVLGSMAFFRQYVAPLVVVLIFLVALVAVSARIFLPSDLAAPAPVEVFEGDEAMFPGIGQGDWVS